MRPLKLGVSVSLLFALMSDTAAFACTCFATPSVEKSLLSSDMVFSGQVVSQDYAPIPMGDEESWDGFAFTFIVDQIWKGKPAARLVVATGEGFGDCGYQFQKGRSYIVYASTGEDDGNLYTSICSRTALIVEAAADFSALPEPKTTFIYVDRFNWVILASTGLGAFFAALCASWWIFYQRKRRRLTAGCT